MGKELNGRAAREMIEARKEARRPPRAANPDGHSDKDKGNKGKKGTGKGKGQSET